METLSKSTAEAIVKWYDEIGQSNWGTWGNYPKLPVGASFHSFDTCHLRIKLDSPMKFGNQTFKFIADSRKVPGVGNSGVVSIYELRNFILSDEEKREKRLESMRNQWNRANDIKIENDKFNALSTSDKSTIEALKSEYAQILGTPNSKKRRAELDSELAKYPKFTEILPHMKWMNEALEYPTADAYANAMVA